MEKVTITFETDKNIKDALQAEADKIYRSLSKQIHAVLVERHKRKDNDTN